MPVPQICQEDGRKPACRMQPAPGKLQITSGILPVAPAGWDFLPPGSCSAGSGYPVNLSPTFQVATSRKKRRRHLRRGVERQPRPVADGDARRPGSAPCDVRTHPARPTAGGRTSYVRAEVEAWIDARIAAGWWPRLYQDPDEIQGLSHHHRSGLPALA